MDLAEVFLGRLIELLSVFLGENLGETVDSTEWRRRSWQTEEVNPSRSWLAFRNRSLSRTIACSFCLRSVMSCTSANMQSTSPVSFLMHCIDRLT